MIYMAKCEQCGKTKDYSRKVQDRDKTPWCCGQPMKRQQTPVRGFVDTPAAGR